MLSLLKDWKGAVDINGVKYDSIETAQNALESFADKIHIVLHTSAQNAVQSTTDSLKEKIEKRNDKTEYRITVKKYMTQFSTPTFDFMAKWNNDNPMPLRTMTGTIEKETRGMIYMKLHGQAEQEVKCMRCGRTLTNPVSKMYGIGPECITHVPALMHLDINDVEGIKKKLVDVKWEGWVIRSAIIEREEIKND